MATEETFDTVYRRSLADPAGFWAQAAKDIEWITPAERVLDDSGAPFYQWFAGGVLNTCHNALDRHVEGGRGDQVALIYDSPVSSSVQSSQACGQRSPGSPVRWPAGESLRATAS